VSSLSRQVKKVGKLSFYTELKRRNVFKVAIVYFAVAWLLLQVSDTLGPALHLPEWFVSAVAFVLILGFPIAVVFAWAFDLTPEGLKSETKADPAAPKTGKTAKKSNHIVVAALVLSLGYFVFDKFVLGPGEDPAETVTTDQAQTVESESTKADRSIAVLPFVNMSSDEEQEYFSDGLSEELLNLLARIPELNVAARTSSFSFKDKDLEVTEIASRLKVAHVLEGSVRKDGNQMRITAQLIQADNGYRLWSETYDKQLDSVFQIQEEIAGAVVDALRITLLGEAPKTRKTDPVAYQLFLEGQFLKRQISTDSLNRAVEVFNQAVEIDPAYVPAWAELADTYMWGGGSDKWSRAERYALADTAIETAISTDPDYAFAYYVRGVSWIFTKRKFKQGIEDFQHALELDPDDAFLVAAIGKGAFVTGQYDLAISQYQAALSMEPLVPEFYFFLGRAYLSSGRLDEAEASFRTLAKLTPPTTPNKLRLWQTLFLKGEFEAALAEYDSAFTRAITHHALGNSALADEALKELIEHAEPSKIASVYGYRGDVDETFVWLDKQLETDELYPTFIMTSAAFRSVHSDPRWEIFLEQLGLLEFWLEMTPDLKH
jgi:TolB-like protein/Tfp pilus assembly protein PilF